MLKRNTSIGRSPRITGLSMERPHALALLLVLVSFFGLTRTSRAQALPVAERAGRINVFGGYELTWPDYYVKKNNGFFVGGNFVLRRFPFGQPALAVRYTRTSGIAVKETFFGGGLESHYRIGRISPYATALFGVGGVTETHGGYSDSGNEFLLGGGADVPITRRFAARGEFTYGLLHISGQNGTAAGEINLNPASLNIGVVYHLR